MRLIDADLLKKNCKCTGKFEDNFVCVDLIELAKVIDAQPTAYNVEDVVEQLENKSSLTHLEKMEERVGKKQTQGFGLGIRCAIDIIKGGVNNATN